jgi:hypothetical protein
MTRETFNINQFVSKDTEYDERAVFRYIEQLVALFEESPEGQALLAQEEGANLWWADAMLEYAMTYVGVSPPEMSANDLREVLFETFPRQVSTPGGFDGEKVVRTLHAFWSFLKREFGLPNADACLQLLDDRTARRMNKEMNDPSNFGMAKTMVMMGTKRGFDMTKQEDVDRWMETFNQEIIPSMETSPVIGIPLPPLALPDEYELPPGAGRSHTRRASGKERRKRKMAEASRKKNRRKR